MAKKAKKAVETVRLVTGNGTKVTVAKDSAEKFKARGFTAESSSKTSSSK